MSKDELIQRYYDGNDSEATCIEALSDEIHRLQADLMNRRSFKAGYTDRDGQPRGAGKGDVPTKERQSKQLEEIIDRLQAENAKLSKENKILKMLLYSSE